jgi:hypothetical protein
MTWLWTVLVFALPLVFVGETRLQRARERKPVRLLPRRVAGSSAG